MQPIFFSRNRQCFVVLFSSEQTLKMSNQRENIDRSAIDKENLDYFKTLIRHLQRIPDNKILLFRQEVDALLLKYAHHYVQNDPAPTGVRESRRRKYKSSDEESDEENVPEVTPKADRRKPRAVQTQGLHQRKAKKASKPTVSDDDDIEIVQVLDMPVPSNIRNIKEEPVGQQAENSVKRERNTSTQAPCHQEAVPTSAFRSGASHHDQQNCYHPPQTHMPNNHCSTNTQVPGHQQQHMDNNGDNYNHFQQTRYQNEVTSGHHAASSVGFGYANAFHPYQHQLNGRETQSGFYPLHPDYRHPTSSHHQYPSNNREMPLGYYRSPPAEYGHSNPPYPTQNPLDQSNNHSSQVMFKNPACQANQQHASGAGSTQEPIGQNPHPPQHDHVHGASGRSACSVTNAPQNPDASQNESPTNRPVQPETLQLPKDSEQGGAI